MVSALDGECAGANDGRSLLKRISIDHAATKRRRGSVVGRLLDMFDKDAGGVAALQHFLSGDGFLRLALRSRTRESDAPDP